MAIIVAGFPQGWMEAMKAGIDFDGATWKLSLHTSTFTPDRDTMNFADDRTNEVANGNGYTTGGVTLASVALSYDATTDQIRFDFADPSWTFTADTSWRYGVVYIDTAGAASTDPLLLLLDWGSTQTVTGVYTVTVDSTGIYAIDMT